MDKYVVKLYTRAYQDLDDIYTYIAETLLEPGTALDIVDELEEAIFRQLLYTKCHFLQITWGCRFNE